MIMSKLCDDIVSWLLSVVSLSNISAVQEATQFSCEPKMKRGQDIRFSICSYVAEKTLWLFV